LKKVKILTEVEKIAVLGLKQMVKAQLLGRKTGNGFYDWTQK